MSRQQTEAMHRDAPGLDQRSPADAAALLVAAQVEAAAAVHGAAVSIAAAADTVAACIAAGGRLFYAAAGSSGLMAMADGLELPGTFGIGREQVVILLAGGWDGLPLFAGGPEDDAREAEHALERHAVGPQDCVIAVSASGTTPYAVAALQAARRAGARTIGIANNADTPLLAAADVPVCLPTPPEVVAGSTRMGAGTAQKIALNVFSTLLAMRLGHVHDGMMVNVATDNRKLWDRARCIVMTVAGVDEATAERALVTMGGDTKPAIVLAAGANDPAAARALLQRFGGQLRPALATLRGTAEG